MTYIPKEYWEERGRSWRGKEVGRELGNLALWVGEIQPKSMLEVGSGWGRVHNHLRSSGYTGHYQMCDFVDSLRQRCLQNTGVLPDWWDGYTLPYEDNEFEMVISFSVLLHVTPQNIRLVFSEHVRVAEWWLFIATYDGERIPSRGGASHLHNYAPLIRKHSLTVAEEVRFKGGERVHWLLRR